MGYGFLQIPRGYIRAPLRRAMRAIHLFFVVLSCLGEDKAGLPSHRLCT